MKIREHQEGEIRYATGPHSLTDQSPRYVFIHGLAGSLDQWKLVIECLDGSAGFLAIDIPGFGGSSASHDTFGVDEAAELIVEFCRDKNLHNCVLVSHSIGCVVAGRVASTAPEIFSRVVLVSGALDRASQLAQRPTRAVEHPRLAFYVGAAFLTGIFPMPKSMLRALARHSMLRRVVLWPFVAKPARLDGSRLMETLDNTGSSSVLGVMLGAGAIPHRDILESILQPVDLIWGESDPLTSRDDIKVLRRQVNLVRTEGVPGCGHWLWIEHPSAIARFLQSDK